MTALSLLSPVLALSFTVGTLVLLIPSAYGQSAITIAPLSPPSSASINIVSDNFAGISLEFNVLDVLIGSDPHSIPVPIQNYLKNLASRISSPYRLRVGGNSLDGSVFDPSASKMIEFNLQDASKSVKNIPVTYGPQVATTLKALGEKIGGARFLLGLSLADVSATSNIASFMSQAQTALGDTIDGFLLGNEPDLYFENSKRSSNYSLTEYISDFGNVAGSLRPGSKVPFLGAPSTCCKFWNTTLVDILNQSFKALFNDLVKYTAVQHYPQTSCGGNPDSNWQLSYFTNHLNVLTLGQWQIAGIKAARAAGKTVLMDEFNSVSCGGSPGRSDTFAAALWTIDYALQLAQNGYSGAYLHTREAGISYDIFHPLNGTSDWYTGPQYYSLMMLADALNTDPSTSGAMSNSGGSVVVDISRGMSAQPTSGAGYAIYDANNGLQNPPRAMMLFNFQDRSGALTLFSLPPDLVQSPSGELEVRVLSASGLTEKTVITYMGQSVNGQGVLKGTPIVTAVGCSQGCMIEIPGPGAALVMLRQTGSKKGGARRLEYSRIQAALVISSFWVIVVVGWMDNI